MLCVVNKFTMAIKCGLPPFGSKPKYLLLKELVGVNLEYKFSTFLEVKAVKNYSICLLVSLLVV